MKILAIETSSDICSVAYIENGKCHDLVEETIPRQHAEKLPLLYNELVKNKNFKLDNVDAIAVSIGPGSFTGLRIGLSYSKGLAYSQNKPIIPVPTLESLLYGSSGNFNRAAVLIPSHKNIYYFQQFDFSGKNFISKKIKAIEVSSINEIHGITFETNIIHFGCNNLLENSTLNSIQVAPSAKWIGELAHKNYKVWIVKEPFKLVPQYISPFKLGG